MGASQVQDKEIVKILDEIKNINGGFDGYFNLVRTLSTFSKENDEKAMQIKHIIEQDHQRDKEFEASTGVKVLGIKQASNGLLENFTKHGITLTQLRKKDQQVIQQFEKHKDFLKELESGKAMENYNSGKIDLSDSENVKQLAQKHELLSNIFKMHIEPTHKEIVGYIEGLNLQAILHDIFVNKRTKMEVFDDFNQNVGEKVQEFRNKVEIVRKGFMKIEEILAKI